MACDVLKRVSLISLFGLIALLAGCETLQPDAVKTQTQGKSLVVVSMLSPNVKLQWIGTTVFNNEYGEISPDTWNLNGNAQAAAVGVLSATGRYAKVAGVAGVQRGADGSPRLPEGTQADFVIVITDASHGDPLFGTNQNLQGLGVVQRTLMGLVRTEIFSAIRIDLYDGASQSMGGRMQFDLYRALRGDGHHFVADLGPSQQLAPCLQGLGGAAVAKSWSALERQRTSSATCSGQVSREG